MSNDEKTVDPTESVRTLTSAPFKEQYMTLREHQDTDRHYIGDALPVPSSSQVKPAGPLSSPGSLPFPARVDHVHDSSAVWGYFNGSAPMDVSPGSVYVNVLNWTGWGRNMLASNQVIAFPTPGIYMINAQFVMNRYGGGVFQGEVNYNFVYNNGSNSKLVGRDSNYDLPGTIFGNLTDFAIADINTPSINNNVQFNIQHNDSAVWQLGINQIWVVRVASLTSS